MANNSQIPLVEEFGVSKTLLSQIANSPYFKKFDSSVFSKILFKPGYPLQSVELIELQDIIQEQIRRFGNHIFNDGSIVTSSGGIDVFDCFLYDLQDGADETVTVTETDYIVFVDTNDSSEVLKARFVNFRSARIENGVVIPTMIGLEFTNGLVRNSITTTNVVDIYVQTVNGVNTTKIGTLRSSIPRNGKYASIKNNIFYISGYFTNIEKQNHIFAVDNVQTMSVEIGVELTWRIVDTTDDEYREQLFDPAQNSLNDNTPGADRLIMQLQLTNHEYGYVQQSEDWKFIPLLKYENGEIKYRVKYPYYSVLGDTLARRTYEINGNFVVDNFKLSVRSDLILNGTHQIGNYELIGEEILYTIIGTDTSYTDLQVGNYVMFGTDIDFNRLLLIKEIESNNRMKVSDIHYDEYDDRNSTELLTPSKKGTTIILRDEEKLNYVLSEGKAYVKGYRFETTFTTRLKDDKARQTNSVESSVIPNQHYFVLDNYNHSENFINFDKLEDLDLHCVDNSILYHIRLLDTGFSQPLPISAGNQIQIGTNGTIFQSVDGNEIFKLISYTKTNNTGLPILNNIYTVTNLSTGIVNTNSYVLFYIQKIGESPYQRNQAENYSSVSVIDSSPILTTIDSANATIDFQTTSYTYSSDFYINDYVIIKNNTTNEEIYGIVKSVNATDITLVTNTSVFDTVYDYTITKPSYQSYYDYQYNSTKIGSIKATSVGVVNNDEFSFSHFKLEEEFKKFRVVNINGSVIKAASIKLSKIDDVYNGLILEHNGNQWVIDDYEGNKFDDLPTDFGQYFSLSNVTPTNPLSFNVDDEVIIRFNRNDVRSIVKSSYINGKEFYGNIERTQQNEPKTETPNQTQKKFSRLLNVGDGEVKSVIVDDYNIFYQKVWTVSGGNKNILSEDIGNIYQENYNIDNNNVKVYAANIIYDIGTGHIKYAKGEEIEIKSANISDFKLTIEFNDTFQNGDSFIIHANIPVYQPIQRYKDLQTYTDSFQVSVNTTDRTIEVDNIRYHGGSIQSFELMHSDLYRIRKVSVGIGKTAPLVDLTNYFDLDNGQRETHYDHGRIVLKPYLTLPNIVNLNTTNAFYYFEVEYDYFESTKGHYFTVDSYKDIHYRRIPTYIDPVKEKYPLRNVIDLRPVRNPIGSIYEFEQETAIISQINYNFDYYLNEEKVISLEGNGSSDIALKFENAEDYQSTDFSIKLYDLNIPAYTFLFEDIEYKMIDNRNYTMKDISKLQKRIENLEDIVQLNALELQSLQLNLTDTNGDPRYTNGLLVDQFAGFAIAKVDQEGFGASIDIKNMKMYPSYESNNTLLKPSPTAIITSSYPRIRNNIIMLPIDSHESLANTIDGSGTTKSTDLSLHNGKLLLYPFSDTWFSKETKPDILLNEDNQFKNWKNLSADNAFKTQWGLWEQFWSGEEIDTNVLTISNATLAQKTGQMINSKNNIEKVINDKKINTTLSFMNRQIRIGFTLELLDLHPDEYQVYVNGNVTSFNQGQRIKFTDTSSMFPDSFKIKYLNLQINQTLAIGTATGIIRDIQHISGQDYYLYVTNITLNLFDSSVTTLDNLIGTISEIKTFNKLELDDQNKLCGDIVLNEGDYPTNTILSIEIKDTSKTVASNQFYLGGLLENKTSFSQSSRPVQRKLFSNDENIYIDDKTHIINSTTRVINPLHQPFIFDQSLFISRLIVACKNSNNNSRKMIFTIQPMVNDNLSPSLVLPFSEKIITVPAGHDGNITIDFDVPIFIPSNSEYAFVFRTENDIQIYTKLGTNNILITNCIPPNNTTGTATEVLQLEIFRAVFNINEKQIPLYLSDNSFFEYVDRYRLNANILKLTDTFTNFSWKARNYDSTVKDLAYKNISPNKTEIVEKRKIFSPDDYELLCRLSSNDNRYSPMLDLERLSITTVTHNINDGSMLVDNIITGRTGANTDLTQVTLSQDAVLNKYPAKVCKLDLDSSGAIVNFYSDPNFLMYTNEYDVAVQKANTTTGLFEDFIMQPTITTTSSGITNISGQDLNINLNISSEFNANSLGNAFYRYFSPIVTLGDDFEAMQLYVQMDALLKRAHEVFVYYRVLENTEPFDSFNDKPYEIMDILTIDADKYSSTNFAKTIEFESKRLTTSPRFKHFQVKICFTSSNFVDVPIVENVRILALDN